MASAPCAAPRPQEELEDAISAERYEDAAVLRDKINVLRKELEALQNEK